MATVIAVLDAHDVGAPGHVIPSWTPSTGRRRLWLAITSAFALLRLPRTTLVHVHLSEGGSFVREGALLLVARGRGLATAITIHGADFDEFSGRHPRLVRAILRAPDLVMVLTTNAEAIVGRLAPGANVHLVPNPVEVDAEVVDAGDQAPRVLFAGEVGERKGADVAHAAWLMVRRARPNAQFTIVGPPTDLKLASADGLEILPAVGREELRSMMRKSRMVILPSRAEALPMVLLEASGSGRPFVSTPVGEIENLANEGGGTTVPVEDAAALAREIVRLIDDPAAATALGLRGREVCSERYSVQALHRITQRLYAEVWSARRS